VLPLPGDERERTGNGATTEATLIKTHGEETQEKRVLMPLGGKRTNYVREMGHPTGGRGKHGSVGRSKVSAQ